MLTVFKAREKFKFQSIRFRVTVGYLLSIGLAAGGMTVGALWAERRFEVPAIRKQAAAQTDLLALLELQEALLESKSALLPFINEPGLLVDYQYHLINRSERLTQLLAHISADKSHAFSMLDPADGNAGLQSCYQAATVYEQTLKNRLSAQAIEQGLTQTDLLSLLNSPASFQIEQCALDLLHLIAVAEETQLDASAALIKARTLEKLLAAMSLLISITAASSLAFYTSRQITRPLRQASLVAQRVSAERNFDLRVVMVHDDEVGVLATSFNRLLERVQTLLHEQQEAKQQLEQYSGQLETTVACRTQELTEKNQHLEDTLQSLKQTQSQLIQAEKMSGLGQMVAGIAHEINNPVNFIHGNLGHAQGYIDDILDLLEQYQSYYPQPPTGLQQALDDADLIFLQKDIYALFQSMQTGTQRIRDIVLSLRNFSRLDESALKAVNLHDGIESTLMILGHRLRAKQSRQAIEVIRAYGDLPPVTCYASQLNQVFMNILANAIDALESQRTDRLAQPHIMISTAVVADDQTDTLSQNQWAVVTIADNGDGIPLEVQPRLFDPFFTTKPIGEGTGLGLSISYQIVTEHHNGQLFCKSGPTSGAEFQIWLPLQQAAPPLVAPNNR